MKHSEKRLLTLFGLMIFGFANFVGYEFYKKKRGELKDALSSDRQSLALYEGQLPMRDKWLKRRDWLYQNRPVWTTEEIERPKLENIINQAADRAGIEVNVRPNAPIDTPMQIRLGLTATAKGPFADLVRFLTMVQGQTEFIRMPALDIKVDKKDQTIATLAFTLERLYPKLDGALPDPSNESGDSGTVAISNR